MSVTQFRALMNDGKFGKNDKTWFPRWLRRYASTVKVDQGKLSVTEAEIVVSLPRWGLIAFEGKIE